MTRSSAPRMTARVPALVLAAIAGLLLAGCHGSSGGAASPTDQSQADTQPNGGSAAPPADAVPERLVGDWVLTAIEGEPLNAAADDAGRRRPTMTIAPSGRVTGDGGVNRWFASLDPDADELAEGRFAIDGVGSTLMAGPSPAMDLERRFHRLLSAATSYDETALGRGVLILRDDDPGELLRFERRAE